MDNLPRRGRCWCNFSIAPCRGHSCRLRRVASVLPRYDRVVNYTVNCLLHYCGRFRYFLHCHYPADLALTI